MIAESSASRTVVDARGRRWLTATTPGMPGMRVRGPGHRGDAGSRLCLLLEAAALLRVLERVRQLVRLAGQHLVEVVDAEVDAVVGHAPLRIVVGADLLRAVARPDLRLALGAERGLLLLQLGLVELRAQQLHRALAVLQLGL